MFALVLGPNGPNTDVCPCPRSEVLGTHQKPLSYDKLGLHSALAH